MQFRIRPAFPEDVSAIFRLIQALADYERLSHQVTGKEDLLRQHLFGDRPWANAIVAQVQPSEQRVVSPDLAPPDPIVGFALYFYNYSTFLTQPGLYLEDLFVLPEYRGLGLGKALLQELGRIAVSENCGRLEWSVLEWNQPSIAFYQRMGAEVLPDWRICRVTGPQLLNLAAIASEIDESV